MVTKKIWKKIVYPHRRNRTLLEAKGTNSLRGSSFFSPVLFFPAPIFSSFFLQICASNSILMRLAVYFVAQFARKLGWSRAEQSRAGSSWNFCKKIVFGANLYGLWLNASGARRLRGFSPSACRAPPPENWVYWISPRIWRDAVSKWTHWLLKEGNNLERR